MEYLKEKQCNSIFVTQSISKILERVKNNGNHEQEIKFIMNKCIYSEDAVSSLTAGSALVQLVERKVVQTSSILSQLLSSLSFTKSHNGILFVICKLLKMNLQQHINSNEKYKCEYNLKVPQHPLISILNQHPYAWTNILNRIKDFYDQDKLMFYASELLYSFYVYVICNPSSDINEIFQNKLWNFVSNVNEPQSLDVILQIMIWFPISSKHSLKASYFFMDLTKTKRFRFDENFNEVVILWLTSLIYELIKFDEDPQTVISTLCTEIQRNENCLRNSASSILVMLTNSILLCPPIYLYDILRLCKLVISSNNSNEFALKSLKVSLLHWMAFKCLLTEKSLRLASEIMKLMETTTLYVNNSAMLYSNKLFNLISCTNEYLYWSVQLNILLESLSKLDIPIWLETINCLPTYVLSDFMNCLTSLLICDDTDCDDNEPKVTISVIEAILKITAVYKSMSNQILILLLYKLSRCRDPRINFGLLKAIPNMAVLDENLPLVINTLELAKKGLRGMQSFSVTLYFDLWETRNKCYSYLQSALADTSVLEQGDTAKMEFYITKAYVAKQLCLKSPERYGSELVGHISEILNSCKNDSGTLATSLALDGIILLCKSGIISVDSTWKALEPHFDKEKRIAIIKRQCEFMGEISYFDASEYSDDILTTIIAKLFIHARTSDYEDVVAAAYKSLSCFPIDEVTLELPNVVDSNSAFDSVSGNLWKTLLIKSETSSLNVLGDLLIKYVSIEVASYRKGVYIIPEGRKEPHNFNYLPEKSILRMLGSYIKTELKSWQRSKPVYLQCLRVLSQEYSKALPPLDWCFLQEFIHEPETRLYCITIASHQVQLSGTARRLMENFLEAMTDLEDKDEDIIGVYQQLKHLCNSIQPMTLRPFIEKSLEYALKKYKSEDSNCTPLFNILLTHLQKVFVDETLQEANKIALAEVIVNITKNINTDALCFPEVLKCIVKLPKRFIDELSSPKLWKETSAYLLKLSVRIRCAVALDSNSLIWINEFINEACFMPLEHNFVLKNIVQIMKKYRSSDIVSSWVLEYLGYIQTTIANENCSNYNLPFLCDVLIVTIIVLSGHDVLFTSVNNLLQTPENKFRLFPQSMAKLMKISHWNCNILQIAEWLYHMSDYQETPMQYKLIFYQTLIALRHENILQLPPRWMKYVGLTIIPNSS